MTRLLTAARMRAIEQAAIDSGRVTGLELMERAGRGVLDAILDWRPHLATTPQRAVVLCGPGNNGGDGFVVARLLRERGWDVRVLAMAAAGDMPPDARANAERWQAVAPVEPLSKANLRREDADLYVDAIFGTGLTRPLDGAARDVISHMAGRNGDDYGKDTVCIDAPSGLCLDSGRVLGRGDGSLSHGRNRFAALTVTFHAPKLGHYLQHGPGLCGRLAVADIGLQVPPMLRSAHAGHPVAGNVTEDLLARSPNLLEFLDKGRDIGLHKFDHGSVLVLAGGIASGGAARLAARAALRVGAGLVTVAPPPSALMANAAHLNAIMLRPVADAPALTSALEDPRINSLVLGPGLGLDRARDLVPVALQAKRNTVLDADALSAFAEDPQGLFDLLHDRCVLTPHTGEFARLFPDIAERLAARQVAGPGFSRLDAVREASARAGCTVLLKGPDTVIGYRLFGLVHAAAYRRAAPWLATAGSGDVLAGMIGGLLARPFIPLHAAATATFLHTECALDFGPGLIAEDLPEALPAVLRRLAAYSP